METFLRTLIKSNTPQPKGKQTGTPKARPKIPPKPKFPPKSATALPLPDDDWEDELAAPIPSTSSKSKGSATWSKGKSPLAGPSPGKSSLSVTRPPLCVKKPSRFGQAAKEGKKLAKEVLKLKPQPGWSEWGTKVQRKLDGKDY